MADTIDTIELSSGDSISSSSEIGAKIKALMQENSDLIASARPRGTIDRVPTGVSCTTEGITTFDGGICMECSGGMLYYVSGAWSADNRGEYSRGNTSDVQASIGGSRPNLAPTPIYDEDGCTVIDLEPKIYATGSFGYWETTETYPMTEDENCEPIYGDMAGKKIRLFKVPSNAILPSFISYKGGVPNKHDAGNVEDDESYVFMTGMRVSNIEFPTETPKPLCPNNPYSILMVPRGEHDKTVVGTGIAIGTFKGEIAGANYAFPKIAVNSLEYFDREVNPAGADTFRGGTNMDAPSYVIHSPDFHFRRPILDAKTCLFEEELSGSGFRHGLYAQGTIPDTAYLPRMNSKGARQSILLNQSKRLAIGNVIPSQCVKGMSYAPAHSVVNKETKFTYSLMNLWKEASVYTELIGDIKKFSQDARRLYGGKNVSSDATSDESFIGDAIDHSAAINNARAFKVTFIRDVPRQYGSVIGVVGQPIGLEGKKIGQTSVQGLVGDSHINPFTVKRSSYVSDKVPEVIAPAMSPSVNIFFGRILAFLLRPLFQTIGLQKIGDIPVSGDTGDARNAESLRTTALSPSGRDTYHPHLVKTNLWFWCNSDVNVDYRQVGNTDAGEVHSQRLKGLMLDSSFPDGWNWKLTYLDRFYSESNEPPKWKYIARVLMNLLFTWGVGLTILIKGVVQIVQASKEIAGGSWGLQTAGAIMALVVAIALVALGILWITAWTISDLDNKVWDHMIGLDLVRPDVKNPDNTWSMYDGRLRQAGETNFFRHNIDLDKRNDIDISFSMGDPYRVDRCDIYDNKMYISNKQSEGSNIDGWKNFKINENLTIPNTYGAIRNVFSIGDKLYAHTTDNIIIISEGKTKIQTTAGEIYLGSGDILQQAGAIFGGIVEGYAGISDPNSAIVSASGYIFPDREARSIYVFGGSGKSMSRLGGGDKKRQRRAMLAAGTSAQNLPEISGGVELFMQHNLGFELLKHYPDFKNVDQHSDRGIGYSFAIDNRFDRIIVTKRDYMPLQPIADINKANLKDKKLFCDMSWTISFDMDTFDAISFHSYKSLVYMWNRYHFYSVDENRINRHHVRGSYLEFDCKKYPFVVEWAVAGADNFKYVSTTLNTELTKWSGCQFTRPRMGTFDKIIAYSDHQNSGWLDVSLKGSLDTPEMGEQFGKLPVVHKLKRYSFSDLYNKLKDPAIDMFTCECDPTVLTPNQSNMDMTLRDGEFRNDYLIIRAAATTLDKHERLLIKTSVTSIDYEVEG
jgi:hypothetical protein